MLCSLTDDQIVRCRRLYHGGGTGKQPFLAFFITHRLTPRKGFAAASLTCFVLRSSLGLGKHFPVLLTRLDDLTEMTEVLYIQGLIMVVGVTIVKISIAYSLLRLATQKLYVRILKGTIIFLIVMTIFCVGTIVFQCMPLEAAWDLSMRPPPWGRGNAQCYSLKTFLGFGLMNSSTFSSHPPHLRNTHTDISLSLPHHY